ncbi:hypothetical protein [Nonomuraea sp. bgisy101]|uniref:hypothetical protein n=1 Tax=Nonomuraea sp. bgisy101 TaxID=3413784 RepID=UPI003D74A41E
MPGTAVRVDLRVGDLRQREMDRPAILLLRRPVHGRPHERVTEDHPYVERQQPVGPVRQDRRRGDAEPFGGTPHQRGVADRLGGGDQQEQSGLLGQGFDPGQEAPLDPARQRVGVQEAESARHPGHGQLTR